jgi:hypothetical protein
MVECSLFVYMNTIQKEFSAALTAREMRILRKVSHHYWSRVTLYALATTAVCGFLLLGVAIRDCARLNSLAEGNVQPTNIPINSEAWLSFMLGSIALLSAIFIYITRRYGNLIRKLAGENVRCGDSDLRNQP